MIYDEYIDFLPRNHKTPRNPDAQRTNFDQFLEALLSQGMDVVNLLSSFPELFDLESATGLALDIIGALVGVERKLKYSIGDVSTYGPPWKGDTEEEREADKQFKDNMFRILIMSKIAANMWDGTNGGLMDIISSIFAGYNVSFIDGACESTPSPMTMQFSIEGDFSDDDIALIANSLGLIRPAGVNVDVIAAGSVIDLSAYANAAYIGTEIIDGATATNS